MSLRCAIALLCMGVAPMWAQGDLRGEQKKIEIEYARTETAHYELHHEKPIPKETVDRIGKELEEILAQYIAIFKAEPKGKLVVKFLDSPNTYQQEGGDKSHPGMYIERGEEKFLLIQQMPFYELTPLVYHEAFHQYLAVYLEGVNAPTWFNEGMAMYYEGMQRDKAGKLDPKMIERRKLRMVKDAIFTREHIPLPKLIDASHAEFHDKEKEGLHYAQSFALIDYFMQAKPGGKLVLAYAKALKESKDGEKALEELFGKERKNLEKTEKSFKQYILAQNVE